MLFQLVKAQATAQLNSDASSRQQQLKKLERGVTEPAEIAAPETNHELCCWEPGEYWSKLPLVILYLYIACCSFRVAIKVHLGKGRFTFALQMFFLLRSSTPMQIGAPVFVELKFQTYDYVYM